MAGVLVACAWAMGGCSWGDSEEELSPVLQTGVAMMEDRMDARRADSRMVLVARARVAIVELPIGMAAASPEIWDHVAQDAIPLARSGNLVENGLRVGIGLPEDWEALSEVLDQLTSQQVLLTEATNLPDRPLTFRLKGSQPAATVFVVHEDDTVSGRDLPAGEYVLALLCAFDPMDPSVISVTGQPQVHGTQAHAGVVDYGLGPTLGTQRQIIGINLLSFQASVREKGFIVIAPSAESQRRSSVGHQLLVGARGGVPVERLVVILPEIVEIKAS